MISERKRIAAVDVLRGLTMALMIIVNNPGNWRYIYAPLSHAAWNGLTPTDCIFPIFLFIMGFSMYLSLCRKDFHLDGELLEKIIRRSLLLYATGLALGFLGNFSFEHLRWMGVLARFAICYLIVALLVCIVNHKALPWIAVALLVGYTVLLFLCNGFEYGPGNILSKVDIRVFGVNHIYNDNFIEPEGLLSTIPAIAHTIIGFCAARLCLKDGNLAVGVDSSTGTDGVKKLMILGACLTIGGFLLAYGCPINKKIWSPTFVMVTCGAGSLLLGLLMWAMDEKHCIRHTGFFRVFGTNSILCYVIAWIIGWAFSAIKIGGVAIHGIIMEQFNSWMGIGCLSSLCYALLMVLIVWAIIYPLYRNKIFIKF